MSDAATTPDFSTLTPRELGSMVTPLFVLPGRFQEEALNELVIRCEVADRLLKERGASVVRTGRIVHGNLCVCPEKGDGEWCDKCEGYALEQGQ